MLGNLGTYIKYIPITITKIAGRALFDILIKIHCRIRYAVV
jgi:hypothetical protein